MEVCMMRYTWASLCITVLVMSDMSLGKSVRNNKATNPYEFTMDITNQIFKDSLLNHGSPDYEILYSEVNGALFSIYGCITCNTRTFYQGVSAMTFSNQTGTVLVKATLVFQTNQINSDVIRNLFLNAIGSDNEVNGLKINPEFIEVIDGSPSTPTSPSNATNTTATTHSTITKTHHSSTTTTSPSSHPTTHHTIRPTTHSNTETTTTTSTHPSSMTTSHPTTHLTSHSTTTTTITHPTTTTTTHPTTSTTHRPTTTTTTTTTRPTTTTTTRPTTTTTTTTTRPTTHPATKTPGHHNAASSFFHQNHITLTSFLCYSFSFCLFFRYSF